MKTRKLLPTLSLVAALCLTCPPGVHADDETLQIAKVLDRDGNVLATNLTIPEDLLRNDVDLRAAEAAGGQNLVARLTIDPALQAMVEDEVKRAYEGLTAVRVNAILMDARTGEILAMSGLPLTPLEEPKEISLFPNGSPTATDVMFASGVSKILTMTAAAHVGLLSENESIDCETGPVRFGNVVMRDTPPLGWVSGRDFVRKMSSVGVAKLATKLGNENFRGASSSLGAMSSVKLGLPGIQSSALDLKEDAELGAAAAVATGRQLFSLPQIARLLTAFTNQGTLVEPRLISSIAPESSAPPAAFEPNIFTKKLKPAVTEFIARGLTDIVEGPEATAPEARVPGMRVAGIPTTDICGGVFGFIADQVTCTLAGFAPAENPEVICIVSVAAPNVQKSEATGAKVAGPIFSRIIARSSALN